LPDERTVALALVVILGTVGLGWGVDYLVRVGAQSVVARTVQARTGVAGRPSVEMNGTVFLWQAVRGRYNDVRIGVRDLTSGPLTIARVDATLHGVHVPFHSVLVRDVNRIVVDRSDETAILRYDDLNRYLKSLGSPLTVAPLDGGQLKLTGTVSALGRTFSASADARVSAAPGGLDVTPTSIDTGVSALDRASQALLGSQFTFRVPLTALPFGQQVTSISVAREAITVDAAGTAVVLPS
jgi:hypothetical protein